MTTTKTTKVIDTIDPATGEVLTHQTQTEIVEQQDDPGKTITTTDAKTGEVVTVQTQSTRPVLDPSPSVPKQPVIPSTVNVKPEPDATPDLRVEYVVLSDINATVGTRHIKKKAGQIVTLNEEEARSFTSSIKKLHPDLKSNDDYV